LCERQPSCAARGQRRDLFFSTTVDSLSAADESGFARQSGVSSGVSSFYSPMRTRARTCNPKLLSKAHQYRAISRCCVLVRDSAKWRESHPKSGASANSATFARSHKLSLQKGLRALKGGVSRPDKPRRKLLREMFESERFAWRNLSTLAHVIGANEETTERLLLETGARGSEDEQDLWGVLKSHPFKKQ
jgi:hypothetical protein